MSELADLYRQERAAQSGSMLYQAPPQRPAPIRIYDNSPPKQLGDYVSQTPTSKHLPRPGESAWAFKARLENTGLQHLAEVLPPAELEAVAQAYNAAVERLEGGVTHDQLRSHLNTQTSGTGIGVMGRVEDRASALGSRFGGREIEKNGGHGDSVGPAPARVDMAAAWQRQQLPAYAQRPEIPAGSSGEGIFIR